MNFPFYLMSIFLLLNIINHQPHLRWGVFPGQPKPAWANSLRLEEKHCRIKTSIEEGASLEWESKALEIRPLALGHFLWQVYLGCGFEKIAKNPVLKKKSPFGEKKSFQLETSNWLEVTEVFV